MELLQLRYFKALAEHGQFTRTADALFISQPALSLTIAKLEKELGVQLFDRKAHRVVLNAYGRAFLKYVSKALQALDNASAALEDLKSQQDQHVAFAVHTPSLWRDALRDFARRYPDVYLDQLAEADISAADYFCLPQYMVSAADQTQAVRIEEPILLAVPPHHPLASQTSVSLAQLANERFVQLPDSHALRKHTDMLCQRAGFLPQTALECDESLQPDMVQLERGVAFLFAKDQRNFRTLTLLQLEDEDTALPYMLYWNRKRYLSKAAEKFGRYLQAYCRRVYGAAWNYPHLGADDE